MVLGFPFKPGGRDVTMSRKRPLALLASASTIAAVLVSAPLSSAVHASTTPATFLKTLAGPPVSPAAMYPSGLTWDAHDNRVVVADTGNDRIEVFSATGSPVLTFGTYGTANGQFDTPREVAVDGSSNIYVVDTANSRLQAFDSSGNWLWTAGTSGSCPSCLNTPIGINYDAVDNVLLVADTGHSLVKAFSPANGAWIWSSPRSILASPREATRGPDGRIWVADYHNQEVKAFNVTSIGTSAATWTTTPAITLGDGKAAGHALGELNFPYNVGFSPDSKTVYVADTGNERIARWDISQSPPVPLAPFGSRCPLPCPSTYPGVTPPLEFQQLRRVTVDTSGNIWAADFWGSGIHEFTPTGTAGIEIDGYTSSAPGFEQAFGVTVASNGTVYGVDRLDQRLEEFNAAGAYVTDTGQRGAAPGSESWPEDAAVAPDLTVWMADTRNNRLEHYPANLSGTPSIVGGTLGSAVGDFNYIEGVTVAATGVVYAADTNNNRIQSYNPTTKAFTAFGTLGSGSGQLTGPEAVAVSSTDMYIADTLNNRIEELSLSGSYVNQFTGLNQPQGIALAPDGTLWVADTMNNRIVHLSSTLTDLGDTFGSLGNANNQFFQPHSLAVYANGGNPILFVADTFNNRIQEFSLGGSGVGPATKLAFTQEPSSSTTGAAFPTQPTVAVEDANGNVVTTDSSSVKLAITSGTGTSGAALSCTTNPLNASSGVAAFSNCAINTAGTGYTLTATDGSLTSAVSTSFNITTSSGSPTWLSNISNANGVAPLYPAAGVDGASGNRFVADSGGSRIVKITPAGVQTTISTAVSDPRAIVLDSGGSDLWVASTSSNSIVEMTNFGKTVVTLGGSGVLNQPYGVADDSTGVYVADTYNDRVVKLNRTTGAVIWTQTTCGGTAFGRVRGLNLGVGGADTSNLYVADTDNDRIVPLNATTGACGTPFGSTGTGTGQFKSPWTLLSDGAGGLWVADAMNFRIEHVSDNGTYISQIGSFGNGPGNAQFRSPHGLWMDGGLLDVADPYTFSIQRFTISAGALTYSSFLGGTQPAAGGFNGAFAATYDSSGDIYAVDWFNDRIQEFSPSGAFVTQWGGYGSKPGSFIFPRGITMQPAGTTNAGDVVVTNTEDNRIDLYQPNGTFVESIKPSSGTAFSRPYQTVAAPDGTYWVADALNNRIVNINASGTVLSTFNDGSLMNQPQGIAMDAEGNLYVSDAGNNAVEKYNQSGTLLATLATSGSGPTNVSTPYALTVTGPPGSEILLIADAGNNRILELTTSGAAVLSFGTLGAGNGQLSSPRGAAVNPVNGDIAVSDFMNNRLSIWS
jgi:sugar lactone lactonase YvrE